MKPARTLTCSALFFGLLVTAGRPAFAVEITPKAVETTSSPQTTSETKIPTATSPENAPSTEEIAASDEQNVFNAEVLKPYGGAVIDEIRLHGLKRTNERAVRWLLSQKPGDRFDPETWLLGLHKLYNTGSLYNLRTLMLETTRAAQRAGADARLRHLVIDLTMDDRWTLVPFGAAQAGGGSFTLGGGIVDTNLFGYFVSGEVGYSVFDSTSTYHVSLSQEYLANTDWMWETDFSEAGTPLEVQDNSGAALGDYTWLRRQETLMVGRRFSTERFPLIRVFNYFELFDDQTSKTSARPGDIGVETGTQYRVRPTLIVGRSQLTNFLEQGYEFTLAPTAANFFSTSSFTGNSSGGVSRPTAYSTFVTTYKQTFIEKNTNYAILFNGGVMSPAPVPYLFRLGGYDSVRGFSTNRVIGRAYVASSLEYRPYLFSFQPPLLKYLTGEIVIQGTLFQDCAMMWDSSQPLQDTKINSRQFLLSQGFGFRGNVLRFANAIGRIDFAHATVPNEGWGVSLGVGQFF